MVKMLAVLLVIIPSFAFAVAPDAPANISPDKTPNWVEDDTLPFRVYGRNAGDWITEIFLGNMKMDVSPWYDAPSDEIGWAKPALCADGPEGSRKVYCGIYEGENWPIVVERDYSNGTVRLFLDKYGTETGDSDDAMGGHPFYNPYDDSVYLMGKGACIRKIVDDGDGTHSISLVAGNCSTYGHTDATGAAARFGIIAGAAADGAGNIWVADNDSGTTYIRKIDSNGVVTSHNGSVTRDDGGTLPLNLLGPNFYYWQTAVSPGRTTGDIHFADSWTNGGTGWSTQNLNTSTYAMTRIQGVDDSNDPYQRSSGYEKDGPGLTHSHLLASGRCAIYSPFYDAVFLSGQDNSTIQIYYYDTGWVYGVAHLLRPWVSEPTYTDEEFQAGGFPTETNELNSNTRIPVIVGTDRYGGVYYVMAGDVKLTFRMYNPTFGGLAIGDIP